MTTKLTIKTYLQLMSLKKKNVFGQSTIYKSFHFIVSCSFGLKKNSIQFKKCNNNNNNNNKVAGCVMYREQATSWTNENEML